MELNDYSCMVNICDGAIMRAVTSMCPNLIDVMFVQEEVRSNNRSDLITAQEVQMLLKDKLTKVI